MAFFDDMDANTGFVDSDVAREKGKDLHEAYAGAAPFPHIVIDNFLPEALIRTAVAEFDRSRHDGQIVYDREHEKLKREYKPDQLSPVMRHLFYAFNSRPFIQVLENISGIKGLIPDPFFMGGGLHEIHNGGRLAVHADFNHHKLMNVERRINLLIYLNEGWQDSYGGQLELWSTDMTTCEQSIVPILNRAVMFNTTSLSNHGNPTTVNHPDNISRKSIALYYYTATWDDTKRSHTTQFRARPQTEDSYDWRVRRTEIYEDFVPPFVRRNLSKLKQGLRR